MSASSLNPVARRDVRDFERRLVRRVMGLYRLEGDGLLALNRVIGNPLRTIALRLSLTSFTMVEIWNIADSLQSDVSTVMFPNGELV